MKAQQGLEPTQPPKGTAAGPASASAYRTEAQGANSVIEDVTQLLKSLHLQDPTMKVCQVRKLQPNQELTVLLHGGATHCLRKARSQGEWENATKVTVRLATGEAHLKQSKDTNTLLVEPTEEIQPIIPVSKLLQVGYTMHWTKDRCVVQDDNHHELKATMVQGCPTVDIIEGEALMELIEKEEQRQARIRKVLGNQEQPVSVEERCVAEVAAMFPEVPVRLVEGVATSGGWDPEKLPWNRRQRRTFEAAKYLVLHLLRR